MPKRKTGTFLRLSYDWRTPTWTRVKERAWNPDDPRVFTPKSYGWGLSINLYALLRKARLVRRTTPTRPKGR